MNMSKIVTFRLKAAAMLMWVLFATPAVQAEDYVFVAHGGGNVGAPFGGEIGIIDLDTGDYVSLTPSLGSLTSLASEGDYLYTYETQSDSILTVAPDSGAVVHSAPLSIAPDVEFTDMTYVAPTGTFYGVGTDDNLYSVNVTTGVASLIGGINYGGGGFREIAAAPDGTFYMHATNAPGEFYILDPTDGSVLETIDGGVPGGVLGIEFSPGSGMLIASECCDSPDDSLGERVFSLNPSTGVATLLYDYDDQRRIQDFAFAEVSGTTRFKVTKTFSDGSTDEVDVLLTCNTGLPLQQPFTIAGGDEEGVTFVVTDIPVSGADCEVTESGGPAGYTTVFNGGDGCSWEDVVGGLRICEIINTADPATYTVYKDFTVHREGGDVVFGEAYVWIMCDSPIDGGSKEDDTWYKSGWLGDGETLVATVDTTTGPAHCSAIEGFLESGVEGSADGCGEVTLTAGGSHTCTFTNTVFFEGIPTLSQYGLALLVLLTLGVGFVGLRRFV